MTKCRAANPIERPGLLSSPVFVTGNSCRGCREFSSHCGRLPMVIVRVPLYAILCCCELTKSTLSITLVLRTAYTHNDLNQPLNLMSTPYTSIFRLVARGRVVQW